MFPTFLIYAAGSGRKTHELLNPNQISLDQPYAREFDGMTKTAVSVDELLDTRKRLIADIQSRFDKNTKWFLLSLHDGTFDFEAIDRSRAANLPTV